MYATSDLQHRHVEHRSDLKGGLTPTIPRKREISEFGRNTRDHDAVHRIANSNSGRKPSSQDLMTQSGVSKLPKWDVTPGVVGIYNHGNTCFMNTILQCLSNTDILSDYFVQRKYKDVFNNKGLKRIVGNVKGEVCEQLGCLLESLWSGDYSSDVSNHLKSVVSKHNAQYKGSAQHDAQEFLLWILDRINEELSQGGKKKPKELPPKSKKDKQNESSTQSSSPEMVLAASSSGFEVYNKFTALYQSSLTCPNCRKHSNTYESYLCLSLPVPQKSTRPVFVTVVYLDDSPKQLKIAVDMNFLDNVKDLREKLAHELYVTPKRLVLCQICDDGYRNTFGDSQPLTDIHESENIYAFETYPFCEINKTPDSDMIQILLVHVEKFTSSKKSFRFCSPEVIKVLRDIDFPSLQRCILKSMDRLAISDAIVEESSRYTGAIFDIRIVDSGPTDCYLHTDVEMPLYTEVIDSALAIYNEEYGPSHVKFVIEWDPDMKEKVVDNDEDIFEEHRSVHKARLGQQQPGHVSLEDCLKLFTKEERLGEGDAWHCPNCQKVQEGAIKKMGLWSAPDILVIHLKRFRHSGLKRNKVNLLVNFPVTDLDMGPHLLPKDTSSGGQLSDLYDLYGVSNHYGNMNAGHYTAFCKNPVDMCWYEFDDTKVKALNQRQIVTRDAYLLFYQRKKLTNNSIDNLMSKSHWVYSINVPPKSLGHASSSVIEGKNGAITSSSEDRNGAVNSSNEGRNATVSSSIEGRNVIENKNSRDYQDLYVNKVNLGNSSVVKDQSSSASPKSKTEVIPNRSKEEEAAIREEAALLEELRRGINSPRAEHRDWNSSAYREEGDVRETKSPRRDGTTELTLRRPARQESKESPRRELFINNSHSDQQRDMMPHRRPDNGDVSDRRKPTIAERIIKSKQSSDSADGYSRSTTAAMKDRYRRSDSVDSSKHSQSFSSDASQSGSAPPSPLDKSGNQNKPAGPVLNNERDLTIINGSVFSSNSKLKIHSNQIKTSSASKSSRSEPVKAFDVYDGKLNQKVNNNATFQNTSNETPPVPVRRDIYGTPQQRRKSPSPPSLVRAWSTPQPVRKQYPDPATPVDRQFSVPPRNNKPPIANKPDRKLEIDGHSITQKPSRSLPSEPVSGSEKPPLPSKPNHNVRQNAARSNNSVEHRPTSATTRSSTSHNTAHTVSTNSQLQLTSNGRSHSGHDAASDRHSHSHTLGIAPRHREARSQQRTDVRLRNRSADRNDYRRSVRARNERPVSYHQTSNNHFDEDDYYLSQPLNDYRETPANPTNFERTGHYATVRQPRSLDTHSSYHLTSRQSHDADVANDVQYLAYQIPPDRDYINHMDEQTQQPRSRAPINIHMFKEIPRYQPHLHVAKAMSRFATKEKAKTPAQYLKESSV